MVDHNSLCQANVDSIKAGLAKLEDERLTLEAAKKAGMAPLDAGPRLTKLKGLIRGAKLSLGWAEKKLRAAIPLEPGDDTDVDQAAESIKVITSSSDPDTNAGMSAVNIPSIDPSPFSHPMGVSSSDMFPKGAAVSLDPKATQLSLKHQAPHAPPSHSMDDPENHPNIFKRRNSSESENDDGLRISMSDMNLLTPESIAQIEQILFASRFPIKKPPKKRVRFEEVSDDSDGPRDQGIFYDDDNAPQQTNGAALAPPKKAGPALKGKEREKGLNRGESTGLPVVRTLPECHGVTLSHLSHILLHNNFPLLLQFDGG
ncbi:hypothetical protein Agabi119p4_10705 [Agaricus bisporus var. burnettii]|uniref:Uncharacterized protein n=1 Tax=Agaricus bisporus var. burnettii TaxID=192524 RepID=A0A8H7C2Q7_AGABI|nr:hypothetical protein Agabi119p4_10705 [Agaricus bisporus var. burnettii]